VILKTFPEFERGAILPLSITVAGQADSLRVGQTEGKPLPAGTRYSPDGGNTWYVLYFGGYITIDDGFAALEVADMLNFLLRMDFSHTDLETGAMIHLEARGLLDGLVSGKGAVSAKIVADAADAPPPRILTRPRVTEPVAMVATEEETAEPHKDTYFEVKLPLGWDACHVDYEVHFLRTGEKGNAYEPVPIRTEGVPLTEGEASGGLYARLDYPNRLLTIGMDTELPAAGTYRLTIRGSYEGICFQQMQMTFFINYSTRSDMETRGAEQ
jgi:hypothetical protein